MLWAINSHSTDIGYLLFILTMLLRWQVYSADEWNVGGGSVMDKAMGGALGYFTLSLGRANIEVFLTSIIISIEKY